MYKNFCCKSLKYVARSYVDFVLKHVILRKVLRKNVWLACSHAHEKKNVVSLLVQSYFKYKMAEGEIDRLLCF